MRKIVMLCVAALLFGSVAHATEIPTPSPQDARIKTVVYEPSNVVRVDGMVGIVTHILLQPGEQYVDHAFGDSAAWWFAVSGNNVFLKPRDQHADTNLVLITNQRIYNFELRYAERTRTADRVYDLRFIYPGADQAQQVKVAEQAQVQRDFDVPRPVNWNYTMTGSRPIAPIHAWDNWQFTYFEFPGATDMPEIYVVNPDGTESIVNHNIEGNASNIVVVHKVAKQWVLRLGSEALSIFNESYDPVGVSNRTRTSSPDVIRTVRRSEKP